MRSGTTWLWSLLASHLQVATAPGASKETHFFDRLKEIREEDKSQYYGYFPRPQGKIAGEWTPRYIYDYRTPAMLQSAAPHAKILLSLRDPVERYISGVAFEYRLAEKYLEKARSYEQLTMAFDKFQFGRSLYGQQLENLRLYYPRSQILILQYERCRIDPHGEMRRITNFLGIDSDIEAYRPDVHTVRHSRHSKPRLHAAMQESLVNALKADTARLVEQFPQIDPSLWPSFTKR